MIHALTLVTWDGETLSVSAFAIALVLLYAILRSDS